MAPMAPIDEKALDTVFFEGDTTKENINDFYEDKIITHEIILSKHRYMILLGSWLP